MKLDKNFVSGNTELLLLKLLEEKDRYGYEMIEELERRSDNTFALKAGTLYPLLHSLEKKEYLTSYEQMAAGKKRKYYSITKSGRRYLDGKKEEWKAYSAMVTKLLGGTQIG